jgi:RimJ/RimL family protein N-acetyltransferase
MTETTQIHSILANDPIWAAYALADLQPAFAPYSRWQVGHSRAGDGVVLLFTALEPPPLFAMGPVDAVADALTQVELPAQVYLTVREEHLPPLLERYHFAEPLSQMWRMVRQTLDPVAAPSLPGLTRLNRRDSEDIRHLYAHGGPFTPDAFDPYQLDDGVFYGVQDETEGLVAVGGTHIIDWQNGAAAIGNMYTHPAHRGRGCAGAILGAIVSHLQHDRIGRVVLNVDQGNGPAQRLYERHGFRIHLPYVEGIGSRKA